MTRCGWCGQDPQYQAYHDTVWGRPEWDSRELFRKLCLDGQQAGLSWITILRKQAAYEAAFYDFDPESMAQMSDEYLSRQMENSAIVRNRRKLESLRGNAQAYLALETKPGAFSDYLWAFVEGSPVQNHWTTLAEVPTETEASRQMSKSLKKLGFSFVGPTICYAFMQAVGMVNDHLVDCHCHEPCRQLGEA
ncbi:DNA-3-methyladenine glycosylase I [Reinekea blandensis]|uniref:DNA-3-methyladenine glycosylase I n=1 Tax=Reinekea blandensis MED297 TaxID=314283 RepID=A4BC57_9GAMM|nr:DNA-3-methyladenine glycosylase I [Reinekea blandensis]EAR10123.1 3-methyladenine DNA glycosylase [Reinekea sp. MED297] [Reinekea blandensis MED297]